jgi:glycosyltransferase involved in cell wall biosynthesis
MRILVLTKRQYTNLDLLDDCFGRLREIPLALAKAGHKVAGICLSYRNLKEGTYLDGDEGATVQWQSLNAKRLLPSGRTSYWRQIDDIVEQFKPDLIWGCSDALHVISGAYLAKKYSIKLIVDLYDNFESFFATRLPGITPLFRKAVQSAQAVTCVSFPLKKYVQETMGYRGPVKVIENAIPDNLFFPMEQVACRRTLGLPESGKFIGTAGHISKSRGIETLFRAFEILARERSDVRLALAGRCDKKLSLPESDRFLFLDQIPPQKVPIFISSLDVNVICNRDSSFGRYCFPQKFYEAIACKVPVIAAEVGTMKELLKNTSHGLYKPDDVNSLVTALRLQLKNPELLSLEVPTWNELGIKVGDFFEKCLKIYFSATNTI